MKICVSNNCDLIILGDSWNYISSILVPSFAKRITTYILVTAKLNRRKDFILRGFFVLSSVSTRNYLFKVSNWITKVTCEDCSRLRIKTLEWCQWLRSSFYILNYERISNFLLIIDFEQANICLVNIKNINTFEYKIWYAMRYVVVFKCDQNLLTKVFGVIPWQP